MCAHTRTLTHLHTNMCTRTHTSKLTIAHKGSSCKEEQRAAALLFGASPSLAWQQDNLERGNATCSVANPVASDPLGRRRNARKGVGRGVTPPLLKGRAEPIRKDASCVREQEEKGEGGG